MGRPRKLDSVRNCRATIRFTDREMAVIQTVAGEEEVEITEAIRRLIFWKRTPEYSNRLATLIQAMAMNPCSGSKIV